MHLISWDPVLLGQIKSSLPTNFVFMFKRGIKIVTQGPTPSLPSLRRAAGNVALCAGQDKRLETAG